MEKSEQVPAFLKHPAVATIFENQNGVEEHIKHLLGNRIGFFYAGMNFIAFALDLISQKKPADESRLKLKQVTLGLATTLFNEQLYSSRCLWFGDIPCALLLSRNGLEDLLLLRYFHECAPEKIQEWFEGAEISPAEVRRAFPSDKDPLDRIYFYLCRSTHATFAKISITGFIIGKTGQLPLGGHALIPDALIANFDNILEVNFLTAFFLRNWYKDEIPEIERDYDALQAVVDDFDKVKTNSDVKAAAALDKLFDESVARRKAKKKT